MKKRTFTLLCTVLIAAATTAQEKYLTEELPEEWNAEDYFDPTMPDDNAWWHIFEDERLDSLIDEAGKRNFSLTAAIENIRIANKVKTSVNYAKQVTNTSDISCTALSLLLKADELSSGRSLDEISIFSEPEDSEPVVEQPRPRELKPGEVPTGRERELTEKEAAAKAEQEAAKAAEVAQEEEEEKAQGRSFFSKMKDNAMKVVKKLIEEEEDER